jgi:hypothetical protein
MIDVMTKFHQPGREKCGLAGPGERRTTEGGEIFAIIARAGAIQYALTGRWE